MSTPKESREEAIKRLNDRASELEAATAPKTSEHLGAQAVSSQAYKIIAVAMSMIERLGLHSVSPNRPGA